MRRPLISMNGDIVLPPRAPVRRAAKNPARLTLHGFTPALETCFQERPARRFIIELDRALNPADAQLERSALGARFEQTGAELPAAKAARDREADLRRVRGDALVANLADRQGADLHDPDAAVGGCEFPRTILRAPATRW